MSTAHGLGLIAFKLLKIARLLATLAILEMKASSLRLLNYLAR